jgi:hypothetical protein
LGLGRGIVAVFVYTCQKEWQAMKVSAEVASAATIQRAIVVDPDREGATVVRCEGDHEDLLTCDVLVVAGSQRQQLTPGDSVLVWRSGLEDEKGVIIGRIGHSDAVPLEAPNTAPQAETIPEELVLEAGRTLTLRVGDGSITIRADGKILIKGKDLVSHAQRTNRIKGGSVDIN